MIVIPLFFLFTRVVTATDFILCTILAGPLPWTGSLAGALPWVGILAGSFPWVAIASSVGSPQYKKVRFGNRQTGVCWFKL